LSLVNILLLEAIKKTNELWHWKYHVNYNLWYEKWDKWEIPANLKTKFISSMSKRLSTNF